MAARETAIRRESGANTTFSVNIEDEVTLTDGTALVFSIVAYKQKELDYLNEHTDSEVIPKMIH